MVADCGLTITLEAGGAGLAAMLAEIFRIRKGRYEVSIILLAGMFAWNALEWGSSHAYFNRMLVYDPFAASFSGLLVGLGLLWLFSSRGFFRDPSETSEHLALVFFALAGCVVPLMQFLLQRTLEKVDAQRNGFGVNPHGGPPPA